MKKFSTLLGIVSLFCMTCTTAQAQDTETKHDKYPYAYIAAKGGVFWQFQPQDYHIKNDVRPIVGIDFGGMITPVVGARLAMEGWHETGKMPHIGNHKYEFNTLSPNLDLMLDVTNFFFGDRHHVVHAYAIGGVGFTVQRGDLTYPETGNVEKASRFAVNYRAGAQIEARASRRVGIFAEVLGTNLHKPHRPALTKQGEWHLQAMLGLNIKIGNLGGKKKVKETPLPPPPPAPAPQPEPAPAPKPEPKKETPAPKKKETKTTEVYYSIGKADVTASEQEKVASLAQWLKDNPDANVTIVGYADAGTGTDKINTPLSEKRAQGVAKLLTDKYGIDSSRISVDHKGAKVQPFADNDKNRVTIVTAAQK